MTTAKKPSLSRTWKNCLRMWEDIVASGFDERIRPIGECAVGPIKVNWFKQHRFKHVYALCFFCVYALEQTTHSDFICHKCPGKLVDENFTCFHPDYEYKLKPAAFLAELKRLYALYQQQQEREQPQKQK